ncbi:MAG: hypothetical protein A3K68_03425 [Euryarchaeota archaeon RBG_16_68_13]|nr:MAG: hypothetical protein A3K68_03425 [Euryarchaeota archaeon RBG_16_68_13]
MRALAVVFAILGIGALLILVPGPARADDCDRYLATGTAPPGEILADCAGRTPVVQGTIAAVLAGLLGALVAGGASGLAPPLPGAPPATPLPPPPPGAPEGVVLDGEDAWDLLEIHGIVHPVRLPDGSVVYRFDPDALDKSPQVQGIGFEPRPDGFLDRNSAVIVYRSPTPPGWSTPFEVNTAILERFGEHIPPDRIGVDPTSLAA